MAGNRQDAPSVVAGALKSGQGQRLVNKFLLIRRIPWCGRLIMPDGSQRNQCAHWLCRGLSGTAVLSALRGSVSKENCLSHRLAEFAEAAINAVNLLQPDKSVIGYADKTGWI